MSTEAQRAPVPPRTPAPPTPSASATPPSATPPSVPPPSVPPPSGPPQEPAAPPVPEVPPASAVPPGDGPPERDGDTTRLRVVPAVSPSPAPVPGASPASPPPPGATRRRPVGFVDLTPGPGAAPAAYPQTRRPPSYPYAETPVETTTRLRPVKVRRPARTAAAAVCAVLGLGLIGGAATGAWLTGDSSAEPGTPTAYTVGRSAWHSVPVDTLFPRTLKGDGAGPGATNRLWSRIAVAADSGCAKGLDPLLRTTLAPVGCERMVRATYTDATHSSVTTVGMIFTEGDAEAMRALSARFAGGRLGERADLMPRTYPVEGTVAAAFGDGQRASWTVGILTEVPVVVFAVSGFADGRTVGEPQPAARAMAAGATTGVALAGLGHEARGVADRVERGLRRTVAQLTEKPE